MRREPASPASYRSYLSGGKKTSVDVWTFLHLFHLRSAALFFFCTLCRSPFIQTAGKLDESPAV